MTTTSAEHSGALRHARHLALHAMLAVTALIVCPAVLAEGTLEVKGDSVAGRTFALQDFAALPQTELTETRGVGTSGPQETLQVRWGGVLLRDVLTAVDFREKQQRDFRRTLIIARARDGYVALFTWGELYNTKLGDSILIITSRDGKPLTDLEGPYALRALADIRPGPRHVKWLEQIQVETVKP